MKVLFFYCVMMACALSAHAQEFKDDSIDAVPEPDKVAFLTALLTTVSDPFSTQVLGLKLMKGSDDHYCGLLNTKNMTGAYTGFKPFRFVASGPRLYLDAGCPM